MEDIREVKITDKNYPKLLKKISTAPKVLYYKGVLPQENEICIGVVGTRRPSVYGQQVTLQITGELADAGITVISGMAPGIDTYAHTACVEKGARTIAVLGTGLNEKSIYPQENLELSRNIIKYGGCLISEFKPGTPGYPSNFAQRNRIISALSLGVLVVEAKEKSGSLITAGYAKIQKKKLFAIPGPIYTLNAKGPNKLIKEGATLVESAQDVLDVLGLEPRGAAHAPRLAAENETEKVILQILEQEALYIDNIIAATKLSPSQIATTLALMEISGKIRNLGGNVYSLN
ncbi:MAG: DNA protecting protein DprA [Candidatus Staskawiczbacteria bacterium RIFCSPHIGHO2_02_FULL_42_22]|uniref:DNA protecting protein DprA n=1 Tax=Candidatus Staskawiczbacteria bacterium RIFCSPHIGHO2_02_FULL_42_22 TaxID=1802207 RepID=A0A1G2I2E9_9BACT|nr:MAG: DNA protecting protein DprA [Candidatus Staskawiczbacteria bacterium RIFCSPHIGHO2_02_FULL_42_22]